jgi:hypothetical protein
VIDRHWRSSRSSTSSGSGRFVREASVFNNVIRPWTKPSTVKKTHFLFALALTTLATVRAGRSQAPEGSSFCANLDSIIQAADSDFRSLRGAPDPYGDGHVWSSRISLPGAQECQVQAPPDPGPSVTCDYQESTSQSDLEDKYAGLAKNLGDCLPRWSKTEHDGPEKYSESIVKETEFKKSPITVRVDLIKKSSKHHPGL